MVVDKLFEHKIDACVFFDPANRQYFTGVNTSFGCVILTKNNKYFVTDFRYMTYAESRLAGAWQLRFVKGNELHTVIQEILHAECAKNVGYEDATITYSAYKALKAALVGFHLKPVGEAITALRAVKTEQEIEKIKQAQRITETAFGETLDAIKTGMTEKDVYAELVFQLIKCGSDGLAFEPIVAFGVNSAKPHHTPESKTLEKGETILFDFGAKFEGYCSDMSRTVCLGNPSKDMEKIYNIVLQAQIYALKNIKAGITASEADSYAREFIISNGYGDKFGHSLGHGVGLDIHEYPRVGKGSEQLLLPGMVITVEPGIYIEGMGGVRIEDMVVVTDEGVQNLTTYHKNIHV